MGNNSIEQKVLFTVDECKYLKTLFNDDNFKRSRVSLKNDKDNQYSDVRTSEDIFLTFESDKKNVLINKLTDMGIVGIPQSFSVLRYDIGQQFKKHRDNSGSHSKRYDKRFKTVVIQLSNKEEYEGGSLIIYDNDKEVMISNNIGNTIIFDSSLLHEVTKITSGRRYSIVFWLEKENFNLKYDLI